MRLRAGLGLICALLAGCRHLPDDIVVDLDNRLVRVGNCQCELPGGGGNVAAPAVEAVPDADAPR